jgi:hypothetical protein
MTRFIVLSQQRSGSHMLMNLLNSHPDIHCNSDSQTVDVKKNGKEWTYEAGFDSDAKVKGFLLKIKTDLYKQLMPNDNIKIIYLKRENFLHILLSKKMAKLFGCYEKESLGVFLDNARIVRENADPINIGKEEAERFFDTWDKKHKAVKNYMDISNLEYLEVKYYDLCGNIYETMKKIYKFLEVENVKPSFAMGRGSEKLDLRNTSYAISNYCELREYFIEDNILNQTKWVHFFKDTNDIS